MDRKTFLQTTGLLVASGIAGKASAAERYLSHEPLKASHMSATADFPLMDLHVHRSNTLTIDDIVAKSKETGIRFGVMENINARSMSNNEQMKAYIDSLRPHPVYIGLQPMELGWSKNFSPEVIAQADYVTMDPQVVPNGNTYGETISVWVYASYIDDPEYFMESNMKHYMNILTGDDPINIFGCPFFLPASIERLYDKLWTKARLQQVIDALLARNIAIEINDLMRVPHEEFILTAKSAGVKFTFGSDTRNQQTGRLDYCKYIAEKCKLTRDDFFIPERQIG